MRIQNTRRNMEKMAMLMDLHMASSTVNTVLTNMINENSMIPSDIDKLRAEAIKLQSQMKNTSVDKIMMMLMVEGMIAPYIGNDARMFDFFMNSLLNEGRVFDVSEIQDNPYVKDIDFKDRRSGDFEFRYHSFMPYELDIYDIPRKIIEYDVDIPRISCFTEKVEYPVIFQNSIKSTWMSVSPNEINTMKQPIRNAKGKVLTLGCGMGYFAYMASLKADVESITIVEREQSVIDFFTSFILPQFKTKDKITVIKDDAIEYMMNLEDGLYDYCFADIWIGVMDFEPYIETKEVCKRFRKMRMEYWIEDAFGILLSSHIYIEMLKAFSNNMNVPLGNMNDNEFPIPENEKKLADYVARLVENVEIEKPEHIDYYLTPRNITSLLDRTEIKYKI
ncbi:hypothetical protein [Anaerocolumna aminovalerica]|uniref:Uncharacterized protein n=1 Tax=Anaerocolumna aminovalerica TaxID=1527 RepID=A0A1I5HH46_9FIRM|nr:hypothetical protein [Anaerocolumna aminovalerica]SFO47286.1 hypothetical protein SAMN04489757_12943 [Anaerocolumna aminovalerica]